MKKILLFFAAAACAIASWAQEATVSAIAKSNVLEVSLTNKSEDFVAFQMDITLPEGVTVADNGAVALVADRLTQPGTTTEIAGKQESVNFIVVYNKISESVVRVIAYNLENRAISGKDGALFNVTFTGSATEDFALSNIKFVTETALAEIALNNAVSVPGSSYRMGDIVGEDDAIDVYDLNALLDIMSDNIDSRYRLEQANPVQAAGKPVEYDIFDLSAILDLMANEI